jgi:phospholipid transport system substrate-binding protein
MTSHRKLLVHIRTLVLAVVALGLVPLLAQAEISAKAFLEQRHGQVMRVLRTNGQASAERDTELDHLLGQLLDYEELSKRSLRDHWATLPPAQQTEFVSLLQQLVQRSYRKNMQTSLDFQVEYVSETPNGADVTVHTRARSKKNRRAPEVTIDYALARSGAEWRVYDVVTDGVSMVTNYRSQFNRIIRKDGWNALIERMRTRLRDGGDDL